ncbi:MAG TPA: ABC transporter ATP-binding protein [Acidimicrobiales bacterium]|nr:ABC transporter ATP-binding protein [Acidimicrobiales bacterium]
MTTADTITTPPPVAEGLPAPALSVTDISLSFGGLQALKHVSFDVAEGELLAIIGPNGAGKTSILNCLNGVYKPQTGSIRLRDRELVGVKPPVTVEAGIARTFQNLGLFVNLDVYDNLMVGRHHLMRSGPIASAMWFGRARREEIEHRRRVAQIIEFLDLVRYRYLPVGMLPYGVQKRVELGRALAMDPVVLLLDEPVAGMNREETEDMARHIVEIRDGLGCSTILIEHQLDLVMDLADRVLVLDFGEVAAIGTPAEIQADPRVVAAYLGDDDL